MVCQKQKPQIDGFFLRVVHILGQEKYSLWRTRLLQSTAFNMLSTRNQITTLYRCEWLLCIWDFVLKATSVKGYHVLLLQVICQKQKQQIDFWFHSALHIPGQGYIVYSPKMDAINWWLHRMNIQGVIKGYPVFLLQVACQKRKPQIDGWFLCVLHILGQEYID